MTHVPDYPMQKLHSSARELRAHPPRGVPKQNQNSKIFRPPTPPFARRLQTYTYSVRFRHRLARIRKWQYDRGGTPKKIKNGTKQSLKKFCKNFYETGNYK